LDKHRYANTPGGIKAIDLMHQNNETGLIDKEEKRIDHHIQFLNLRRTSETVWKTSRRFDLDTNEKDSRWDKLVEENVL
jgi:hypothetical protein